MNQLKGRVSVFSVDQALQADLAIVVWFIVEIIKIAFLLEPVLLFMTLKKLRNNTDKIEQIFSFVGETDSLYSIAMLRESLTTWCRPVFRNDAKQISVKEIYHPLIRNCVANSFELHGKSMLITGSNMSGKSSFIRTVGLNVITGLTINTCFAKSMSFPICCLYSVIRVSDDLMSDKSYYFEEAARIKEIIDRTTSDTEINTASTSVSDTPPDSVNHNAGIILLDEIFKGTNTTERIAAAKAVLSYLAQSENIIFISTHDAELSDLLSKDYDAYHFSETVDTEIRFNYTLLPGKDYIKNAISILKLHNYPDWVIKDALGNLAQ